ncbi:MAG: trypsin-like peptidase domain-containing protein [Actinomycetota bacterium]|nr:trypsin-like peptidase domain-containing protein [Actinomycetota bacterium]
MLLATDFRRRSGARRPAFRNLAVAALAFVLALTVVTGCGSGSDDAPETGTTSSRADVPEQPELTGKSGEAFNPSRIFSETIDGVVSIRAIFGASSNPLESGAAGGSGFVLNDDGEIVTNAHVISNGEGEDRKAAGRVFVEFTSGDIIPAKVLGFDPFSDVALLRVDPAAVELTPLKLGDSDEVVVGEPIAVIGSPFGEDQTLTTGIVSQTGRSVMSLTDFQIEGAIQTDASINPGNSGGPMLGSDSQVIGISQQMKSGSGSSDGVGFGVPVNTIKRSTDQLRENGQPSYAYIGVSTQPLYPQLAEKLGIEAERGAMVAQVMEDGPADKAGLRGGDDELEFQGAQYDVGGDVIVKAAGEAINRAEDLGRIIGQLAPGDTVELEVVRGGQKRTVEVTLRERPTTLSTG